MIKFSSNLKHDQHPVPRPSQHLLGRAHPAFRLYFLDAAEKLVLNVGELPPLLLTGPAILIEVWKGRKQPKGMSAKKKEILTVPSRTSCLKVFIGPMKKCDLRKGELLKIISFSSSPRVQLLPKPREKTAGRSEANPEKKAVARGGGHF